jgi:hypothetical protein
MREVRRGHTIRLRVAHYADGTLAAPDTYTISIEQYDGIFATHDDGAAGVSMDGAAMTEESTGIYYYDFKPSDGTTLAAAPTGIYKADYFLTTGTFVAGPPEREFFLVVKEVG